jgi:hypothetical protein
MVKSLAGALAILLAAQQAVQAETAPAPAPETACRWGVCLTDKEMIVGGIVVAGSTLATALTVSPYGAQQAGEVAAGFLLSSVLSTAASLAVVGAVVYYYGPGLWQHLTDQNQIAEPAWRQYLDDSQQEIGWPDDEGMIDRLVFEQPCTPPCDTGVR